MFSGRGRKRSVVPLYNTYLLTYLLTDMMTLRLPVTQINIIVILSLTRKPAARKKKYDKEIHVPWTI